VPPVPGTPVVNVGHAFDVVTNKVCKATTHRVLLPPGDYDRYSVPFSQGVRPDLTKGDLQNLWEHFSKDKWSTRESEEGQRMDSPFLRGKYKTWGAAQLRTKIRSHRDIGLRHYADVFDKYVNDDQFNMLLAWRRQVDHVSCFIPPQRPYWCRAPQTSSGPFLPPTRALRMGRMSSSKGCSSDTAGCFLAHSARQS